MKRTKFVVRIIFFLLMLVALVYINRKPAGGKSIAEFKLKMIEQIRKDSLDTSGKADMVVNETAKFMDDSTSVKKASQLLLGVMIVWAILEVGFFVRSKRA